MKHQKGMAQGKDGNPGQGSPQVDVTHQQELSYWARAIRISEADLVGLVERVGPELRDIMRAVILRDIHERSLTPRR